MGKCVLANQVCPQTSSPTARRYCPAWWETVAHDDNGNQRVIKGCAWGQLPMYLNEFAQKAATAAATAQEARNEIAGLGQRLILTLHSPVHHAQIADGRAALGRHAPNLLEPTAHSIVDLSVDK